MAVQVSFDGAGSHAWLVNLSACPTAGGIVPLQQDIAISLDAGMQVTFGRAGGKSSAARVTQVGDAYVLHANKADGIRVNESTVVEHQLREGDILRFGGQLLKFLEAGSDEIEYHFRMQNRATLDTLTGAYNKAFMQEFLQRELKRCLLHRRPLSVLMMDLDLFKQINDTLGHVVGDEVLKEFANRVSPMLDADDIFARYGGEEFAVVMCENDVDDGQELALDIQRAITHTPFATSKGGVPVTVSIGVAGVGGQELEPPSASSLVEWADQTLYAAKSNGRNRVEVHREPCVLS